MPNPFIIVVKAALTATTDTTTLGIEALSSVVWECRYTKFAAANTIEWYQKPAGGSPVKVTESAQLGILDFRLHFTE